MNPRSTVQTHRRRQRSGLLALMAILILSTGCSMSSGARGGSPLPVDGAELPILRTWSRAHSHENRAMQLAIRNASDLSQIPLDEFDIDFENEMALVVTLGRMPSDAYQVRITRVRRDRGRLIADVEIIQPPADAPLAISSPYCVAITPRCDLPVDGFATRPPNRTRSWSQSELAPGR
ncbi:MAG TPA: protease complex subunit PrcB family protein [Phycisphaerae bacterium]|nr:protease complex subunit PrcB family protein [Phycisphaerae bacterium]HRW51640.1 protease complex subunit PrcB family protein [Phycisphaerae bacterium]